MQRTTKGTPFQLRSGSPFKQEPQRMVRKTDDNRNELVDVTKGSTNVRKTWKQAWADNDEGIQGMYNSYEDYVADRKGQKAANEEAYEADMVAKTGVSGGPGTVQTPDKVTPVASPGETIPEVKGDMKDTFTPQDLRMAGREMKISDNQLRKNEGRYDRKSGRYDKALGKAGYNFNMAKPSEFTTDEEGKEVPNMNYESEMQAFNNNEAIKATFDKTRKGKRLGRGMDSAERRINFYKEHSQRTQEGADQGVNPNKGRMIEEGKVMQAHQPESTTEGSDRTFVGDDHGYDVYEPGTNTGGGNNEVVLTDVNQGGGDENTGGGGENTGGGENERGMIETFTGSDLSPEAQRTQANLQRTGLRVANQFNPISGPIINTVMGSGDHKEDFEGDRDPVYEPTWWDGAKKKFGSFISGISNASKSNAQVNSEINKSTNKFGGPKMKFSGPKKKYK